MFWNELKISPIKNARGDVQYFVGIQNDVTNMIEAKRELREAKDKWQNIANQNPNMLQISVDGVITYMNRTEAEFHGFDDPGDMIGISLYDLHPKEEHNRLKKRVEVIKQGKPTEPVLYTTRDGSGNVRYLKIQSIPIMVDGRAAAQTVGEDVTILKNSEIELTNLLEQKQILLQEVHQRVKNNLAVLNALLGMQMAKLENSETISVLADTQMRILSISKVHKHLYNQDNLNEIGFDEYVKELALKIGSSVSSRSSTPVFNITVDSFNMSLDQLGTCGLLLSELTTNFVKHAFEPNDVARIDICVRLEEDDHVNVT